MDNVISISFENIVSIGIMLIIFFVVVSIVGAMARGDLKGDIS